MAYYCGSCGSKLKSVQFKKGEKPTGTKKYITYKVFNVNTLRCYKCPNECKLNFVKQD